MSLHAHSPTDRWLWPTLAAFVLLHSSQVRVALRAVIEGSAFSWSYVSGLTLDHALATSSGRGLSGHTDYLLAQAFVAIWLLAMGLRRPDRFFQPGLLAWNSIALGMALWLDANVGDTLRVEKQTLGISLPHFWANVFPAAVAWSLALIFVLRNWRRPEPPVARWTRRNTLFAGIAVILLLATAVLLNLGPQHGTWDRAGIGTLYAGLFAAMAALARWRSDRTA
jgi:hypothetical protein